MQDLAPHMGTKRTHKELKNFDWRIGTGEDAREFQRVLKGEGEWEKVQIPHYGEPVGLATTYYRTEFELSKEKKEKDYQKLKNNIMAEVKKEFKPEFLNRIDETIVFKQLSREEISQIVDLLQQFPTCCMD